MQTALEKAYKFFKEKSWDAAHSQLLAISDKQNDSHPEVLAKLSVTQRHLGLFSDAKKTLKKALLLYPHNTQILIEFAAFENTQNNWRKAVEYWKAAKKQDNNFSMLNYQRYSLAIFKSNEDQFLTTSKSLKKEVIIPLKEDTRLQQTLIELLKKRITEIRNEDKNKNLALQLSKSTLYYFKDNTAVEKELAISYMHSHEWDNAIILFEKLLHKDHQLLDIYDYHRLLKSYEMAESFNNYEPVLLEAIRKFPDNQDLHFRHLFNASIQNIQRHNYDTALQTINLLLGTKKPSFWGIDKQRLLNYRSLCISHTKIKSINSDDYGLAIISNRADGLGERLNAMLNAIVMAKTLGYRFGYTWKDLSHAQPFQKGTENKDNLIGHAIVDEQDFFDEKFIEKHSVTTKALRNFRTVSEKNLSYESLFEIEQSQKLSGWFSPRLSLKDHFSSELLINSFSYGDAFSFIRFSKPIKHSIEHAKKVMDSKEFIALHLRSGDVFYGEYRKFLHYSYKGIVLPLAKKIIEDHIKKNLKVVVFGQDEDVLNYLKKTYGVVLVEDFVEFSSFDNTQKAMFEITLMSQAKSIIAGSSGFAKLASWIGSKETKSPIDFYNSKKQSSIIKNDLADNADIYHKLQSSFAYWYGYFYGRNTKNIKEIEFFLKNASKYDPDNELYPLVLAAHYYKNKNHETAETIVKKLFHTNNIFDIYKHPAGKVLQAKTMGKPNMLEYFPYIQEASQQNLPYAILIMYIISDKKDDNVALLLERLNLHTQSDQWLKDFINYNIS